MNRKSKPLDNTFDDLNLYHIDNYGHIDLEIDPAFKDATFNNTFDDLEKYPNGMGNEKLKEKVNAAAEAIGSNNRHGGADMIPVTRHPECAEFEVGHPDNGACQGNGHFSCKNCKHFDVEHAKQQEIQSTMKTFTFKKESDNRWYIILPSWTGDKSDLEMVCGADTMLDIMSQGDNTVYMTMNTVPYHEHNFTLTHRIDFDGGAWYDLKSDMHEFEVWLCHVTKFVFGELPKTIYCN